MTELSIGLTSEEIGQADANLANFEQFMRAYLEDPDSFDVVPSGSTLIFLPAEDHDVLGLRAANLRIGAQAEAEGKNVVYLAVGSWMPIDRGTQLSESSVRESA